MYPNYVLFYFTLNLGYSAYASQFLICVKIKEKIKSNCVRLTFQNRTGSRLKMTIEYRLLWYYIRNRTVSVKRRLNIVLMNVRGIEPCLYVLLGQECRIHIINVVTVIK